MTGAEDTRKKPEGGDDGGKEEDFSFINETVKEEKKKNNTLLSALKVLTVAAFVFGAFVIFIYFMFKPALREMIEESLYELKFPEDRTAPDEVSGPDTGKKEKEPEDGSDATAPGPFPVKADAESLEKILGSVYETVRESGKSMVYIRPASPELEDFGYGHNSAAGILVAENRSEFFILCGVLPEADSYTARFPDNRDYEVELKKQDRYTGLSVLSMPKNTLDPSSFETVKIASLGNSNLVTRGNFVFALGNLSGYDDGAGYGIISTSLHHEMLADRHYNILYTDMASASGSTGFLFNLSGEAVGFIHPALRENGAFSAAKAIAISDLKKIIELLVNGESVPYAGVYGVTVTEAASRDKGMPQGVYVSSVETDSPAMAAGIQSGDILQEVAGTKIMNAPAYEKAILERKAGENIVIRGSRLGAAGYVDIEFSMTVGGKE